MATTIKEIKKSNSLVSFKKNIKLRKDHRCLCRVCKTDIGGLGFIQIKHADPIYFVIIYYYYFFFVDVTIVFSTLNKVNE